MDWKRMLKIAMVEKGTNALRVSFRLDKSANYITNILNKDSSPTLDTLTAIADALGYDLRLQLVDRETGRTIDA